MKDEYLARYPDLSARHWWWTARRSWLLETIESRWGPRVGRILIVGCGPGHEVPRLAEMGEVVAVEPEGKLPSDRARARATILENAFAPGLELPGTFDLVLMADVLEHLPRPAAALRHAVDHLRSEGRVLVTVPAFPMLWTTHDDLNDHLARYTRSSLRRLADEAGMEVETLHYLFHWLFLAKLVHRGAETVLAASPSLPSIPPLPINRLLHAITRLEQKLLTPLRPPFGTSLVAIGGRR